MVLLCASLPAAATNGPLSHWPVPPVSDRRQYQLSAQGVGHHPADDAATEHIQHHRQVEQPDHGAHIGDVSDPQLVQGAPR